MRRRSAAIWALGSCLNYLRPRRGTLLLGKSLGCPRSARTCDEYSLPRFFRIIGCCAFESD